MKRLHRKDLYGWSKFQESLDLDFNSVLWVRQGGNVVIDPLPLSEHDAAHLRELDGAAIIVITNSMHLRAGLELKQATGARLLGPIAEREKFANDGVLKDGGEVVPGLVVRELQGSKTPGELALILEDTTLITGDLVRAHAANSLHLLSAEKLKDRAAAIESMKRVLELHPRLETILVGDGWHLFSEAHARLNDLLSDS
jgi:glyoxylase-like metal-dependent hydrolase (beta-lactamase superfamily II)